MALVAVAADEPAEVGQGAGDILMTSCDGTCPNGNLSHPSPCLTESEKQHTTGLQQLHPKDNFKLFYTTVYNF